MDWPPASLAAAYDSLAHAARQRRKASGFCRICGFSDLAEKNSKMQTFFFASLQTINSAVNALFTIN